MIDSSIDKQYKYGRTLCFSTEFTDEVTNFLDKHLDQEDFQLIGISEDSRNYHIWYRFKNTKNGQYKKESI